MQDTLIIDTSNAPCGPGSIPGLRPSEGRFQSIGGLPSSAAGASQAPPGAFVPLSTDRESAARFPSSARDVRGACGPSGHCLHSTRPGCSGADAARVTALPPRSARGGESGAGLSLSTQRVPSSGAGRTVNSLALRPQIGRDDPLNLSILLSGGKETNKDSLSSGERRGKSPAPNPRPRWAREMWRTGDGRRPGVDRGPESF